MNSLVVTVIVKVLTSLGMGFIERWLARDSAINQGRQEQANADKDAASKLQNEMDTVAVNPPSEDEVLKRLKDGSA